MTAFLEADEMLTAWRKSDACKRIASETRWWGFLTSFSRSNQLGADIAQETRWDAVLQSVDADLNSFPFETKEDIRRGSVGETLTAVLLVSFLEAIGLKRSATVEAVKAPWVNAAMESAGFSRGWLATCPSDDVSS